MVKFCTQCGHHLEESFLFCTECGHKINQPTINNAQIKQESFYEYLKIRVAGVTFKNGRKSRQAILRKIKFRDPPFDNNQIYINFEQYNFEGEDAIAIKANGEQIGNVPRDQIKYIMDNWDRIDKPTGIDVYGGGRDNEGYVKSFGAELTLRLFKEKPIESADYIK